MSDAGWGRWLPQIIHWDCPHCSWRESYPSEGDLREIAEMWVQQHLHNAHGYVWGSETIQ